MELLDKATRLFYASKATIVKHSPEILMVAGIAGTVATTVIACKQTLKVDKIIKEHKEKVDAVHTCIEEKRSDYTEQDAQKDLTITYTQTGVQLVKLYAPAIGLGVLSITAIVSGHKILKKRNVALAAAYAIVDKSFKSYRSNVVERFGAQVDDELRHNIKAQKMKTRNEDGKSANEEVQLIDGDLSQLECSDYARFFDSSCQGHTKDPEYNLMYLRQQQSYCNEILKSRGYLFLNEVYKILDIPQTKAGQIVGWVYNKDENKVDGDNYVDFGIYNTKYEPSRRFVNGCEYNILLDFNVDGPILDKIGFGRI